MEHYLGKEIPKLGFGLMRLPKNGEEIDVEQTKEMVDLFLEAGFMQLLQSLDKSLRHYSQ